MGNDIADAAEVLLSRGVHIVKRRLQNGRREGDIVGGRAVACVYRKRLHCPRALIDRLVLPGNRLLRRGLLDGNHIREERAAFTRALDFCAVKIRIPAVGIADLDLHRIKLSNCLLLRRIRHPVKRLDPRFVDGDKLADHFLHVLLGLFGEMRRHIGSSEVVGKQGLHLLGSKLPGRLAHGNAEVLLVKIEARVRKFRIEAAAHSHNEPRAGKRLERCKISVRKEACRGLHRAGVEHKDPVRRRKPSRGKHHAQVYVRELLFDRAERINIVDLIHIAIVLRVIGGLRHSLLRLIHKRRARCRVLLRKTRERQKL